MQIHNICIHIRNSSFTVTKQKNFAATHFDVYWHISEKEPYISAKEPYFRKRALCYIAAKEPYISAKKTKKKFAGLHFDVCWHISEKEPYFPQKSPSSPQKKPLLDCISTCSDTSVKRISEYHLFYRALLQKRPMVLRSHKSSHHVQWAQNVPCISAKGPFWISSLL